MAVKSRVKIGCKTCGKARQAAKEVARWAGKGFPIADYQARISICQRCEEFSGLTCNACGCLILIKARMATTKCPLGKWPNDS